MIRLQLGRVMQSDLVRDTLVHTWCEHVPGENIPHHFGLFCAELHDTAEKIQLTVPALKPTFILLMPVVRVGDVVMHANKFTECFIAVGDES